jgi:ribosome assembly protein 1
MRFPFLTSRFAKVAVTVSKPIVPFRETIVEPPKTDMVNEVIESQNSNSESKRSNSQNNKSTVSNGVITQITPNKKCTIKLRAAPLPKSVTDILEEAVGLLTILKDNESLIKAEKLDFLSEVVQKDLANIRTQLANAFKKDGWDPGTVENIWSFGPKKCGPNLLINKIPRYSKGFVWPKKSTTSEEDTTKDLLTSFDSNFVHGFQLATLAGPLCEEPLIGVAFIVEDWTIEPDDISESSHQPFGPFSGQIMSSVKDACRKAFQAQPQRLMVAMYSCSIQVNSEVLGKRIVSIIALIIRLSDSKITSELRCYHHL